MRREEKRKRREERRQDDPGPKLPDSCRAWGVIIFAMYVSRVRIRVRGSYEFFLWVPLLSQSADYCSGAELNISGGLRFRVKLPCGESKLKRLDRG